MDVTGIVSIAQSTTTPGLNKLLANKAGTVRLIALAGGAYSPIMTSIIAAVAPPPPHVPVMTMAPAKSDMVVGEVRAFSAYRDGALATDGIAWSSSARALITPTAIGASWKVEAAAPGLGVTVRATDVKTGAFVEQSFSIVPSPVPVPISKDPSPWLSLPRLRAWITMVHTNFNYNWTKRTGADVTAMERLYASRYDVTYSGTADTNSHLKVANPHIRSVPYSLLLTTLTNDGGTPNIQTVYQDDFDRYCAANGISAADAEACWLKKAGDKNTRVLLHTWDSPRNMLDPTNAIVRAYQIDRFKRIASGPIIDGVFIDEFGSNMNRADLAQSAGADTVRLQALCDADTSLLSAIALAILPKQLVINTGGYIFAWDAQETRAARGSHMEQTNNPMAQELWANNWPYMDARVAEGDWINMVPLFDWGHYEKLHDALTADQHLALTAKITEDRSRWSGHPVRDPAMRRAASTRGWDRALPTETLLEPLQYPPSLAARAVAKVKSLFTAAAVVGNAMDSARGKLLELVSYYMVVTDPALLGLSIENGDWGTFTPTTNWLYQIDVDLGLPIEIRQHNAAAFAGRGRIFHRRFAKGLVVANLIPDRSPADYGPNGGGTFTLPTDRAYARVLPDGTLAQQQQKITLRCPEAAIFVAA